MMILRCGRHLTADVTVMLVSGHRFHQKLFCFCGYKEIGGNQEIVTTESSFAINLSLLFVIMFLPFQ